MKVRKSLAAIHTADRVFTILPRAFIFYDKKTGTRRFEIKANRDGSMPVHHGASLLAAHCVTRGQIPKDFGVVIEGSEDIVSGLGILAEKLIHDCQMLESPVWLTPRQEEILRKVLQHRSNKEIAEMVNLSVRTVKFHISALLRKFDVPDRMSLKQKATDLFTHEKNSNEPATPLLVADSKHWKGQEPDDPGVRRVRMTGIERRSCR